MSHLRSSVGIPTVERMTYTQAEELLLLPIGEAARRLGVSIDTVRRWDAEGKITCVRTVGKQRRIPTSEIDRLLGRVAA